MTTPIYGCEAPFLVAGHPWWSPLRPAVLFPYFGYTFKLPSYQPMNLEETLDYMAEEYDLERSDYAREIGRRVAHLRD